MSHQTDLHRPWRRTTRPARRVVPHARFDERRTLSSVFGEATVRQWRGW